MTNYPINNLTLHQLDLSQDNDTLEIDVKLKRKAFHSFEEKQKFIETYTKKIKTELCKNYQLTAKCKFGDKCSFAHGNQELAEKTYLHEKFKTKPCQRYFKDGYCNYGIRCQYIHQEIKDTHQFWDFLKTNYRKYKLTIPQNPRLLDQTSRFDIQRFQSLNHYVPNDLCTNKHAKRLSYFSKNCNEDELDINSDSTSTHSNPKDSFY